MSAAFGGMFAASMSFAQMPSDKHNPMKVKKNQKKKNQK